MIENAGLIAYIWFILGNLEDVMIILLSIGLIVALTWAMFNSMTTNGFSWLNYKLKDIEDLNLASWEKDALQNAVKSRPQFKLLVKVLSIAVILSIFIPTRNQLVVIFSAKPLIKSSTELVYNIQDSNTTKSITSILDNSLQYLEKASKNLNK